MSNYLTVGYYEFKGTYIKVGNVEESQDNFSFVILIEDWVGNTGVFTEYGPSIQIKRNHVMTVPGVSQGHFVPITEEAFYAIVVREIYKLSKEITDDIIVTLSYKNTKERAELSKFFQNPLEFDDELLRAGLTNTKSSTYTFQKKEEQKHIYSSAQIAGLTSGASMLYPGSYNYIPKITP